MASMEHRYFDFLAGMDAKVYGQTRTIRRVESGEDQDKLDMRWNVRRKALAGHAAGIAKEFAPTHC